MYPSFISAESKYKKKMQKKNPKKCVLKVDFPLKKGLSKSTLFGRRWVAANLLTVQGIISSGKDRSWILDEI